MDKAGVLLGRRTATLNHHEMKLHRVQFAPRKPVGFEKKISDVSDVSVSVSQKIF